MPADASSMLLTMTRPPVSRWAFLLETADFAVKTYESAVQFLERLPILEAGCIVTTSACPK